MKKYVKRALVSGAVLSLLSGAMALLIVGADFLTRDTIARNAKEKERQGLIKIFGNDADYGEAIEVEGATYIEKYWTVSIDEAEVGRVYRGSGRNGYGEVSLLFGIDNNNGLGRVVALTNTESYGTVLKENYLDPLNEGGALDDVSCGATYGAKLCRFIILEGIDHYQSGGNS